MNIKKMSDYKNDNRLRTPYQSLKDLCEDSEVIDGRYGKSIVILLDDKNGNYRIKASFANIESRELIGLLMDVIRDAQDDIRGLL